MPRRFYSPRRCSRFGGDVRVRAFVRPSIMNFVSPAQNEAISRVILRDIPLYYQYQQQYAYQFSESAVGAGHRHHQRSADQIQSRVQKYSKLRTVTLSSRAGDPPGHVYNNINTERNLACPDARWACGGGNTGPARSRQQFSYFSRAAHGDDR